MSRHYFSSGAQWCSWVEQPRGQSDMLQSVRNAACLLWQRLGQFILNLVMYCTSRHDAVATKLPTGGRDRSLEASIGLQCRQGFVASLPRSGWQGRLADWTRSAWDEKCS